MMMMKLILATLFCFVLVRLDSEALSVEELKFQYDGELADLRATVSALQGQVDEIKQPQNEPKSPYDVRMNDTEELEARVSVLEESMLEVEEDIVVLQTSVVNLADEVDNVESANIIQDDRINTLEAEIFDNENDIEELVDATNLLQIQVTDLEEDVLALDVRVSDLESGGGNINVTDLTERVEALEEVTSQMSDDISELQTTTEDFEARIAELESVIIEPWEACLSSPCANNGTCIDVNVDTFICSCNDGYFGLTCLQSYLDAKFLASLQSDITRVVNPVIFTNDAINPGGHYSTETGKYTVLYDGIYEFFVNMQYVGGNLRIDMRVDDSTTGTHNDFIINANTYYRSFIFLQQLSAGQTVHVVVDSSSSGAEGSTSQLSSYFSGYMLSQI